MKSQVEIALAAKFARHLSRMGIHLVDLRPGDANRREPDIVGRAGSELIGIEIASAHYDDEEAENTWSMLRGRPERNRRYWDPSKESPQQVARRMRVLINPSEMLVGNLNRTLADHASKSYSLPTYLVLDARFGFITPCDEGHQVVRELNVPRDQTFVGIFLAMNRNWTSETDFLRVVE